MANWCNNHLVITSRVPLTWIHAQPEQPGYGILIGNNVEHDVYAFGLEITETKIDNAIEYHLHFLTKWAPPSDYYMTLSTDDNIITASAQWSESGCQILGSYSKEIGLVDETYPEYYYSDLLGCEVMKDSPCQTYIDMEGDSYILLENYPHEIDCQIKYGFIKPNDAIEEAKLISEYFES